ncbi:hypothetical protein ACP4OV_020746 [Aristida adscensionis]
MNGEQGNVRIDICRPPSNVTPQGGKKPTTEEVPSLRKWLHEVREFARQDRNRVTFPLKVGLACLLVSLLILFSAPYQVFGADIVCGATLNRGFNRAIGSILAGVLAVVVLQVAASSGHMAEPYMIGFSIFLLGAGTSFMKLWPSLIPYEYGLQRTGFPWLQSEPSLVKNLNSLADSLEGCVKKYLSDDGSERREFSKTVTDDFPDEPAFRKFRATLNSFMATSAKWEPPHGRFRHFFYPWAEYVKVGKVPRHCAYEVIALHVCTQKFRAPYNLRCAFQSEILDATNQAADLLRSLAKDVNNMEWTLQTSKLKNVHDSIERLQRSIDFHLYLLTARHEDRSARPQLKTSGVISLNLKDATKQSDQTGKRITENATVQSALAVQAESCHETTKRQHRRLHSWPPREVHDFDDDGDAVSEVTPRMRAIESTAALSLTTFTSLLIEFVARLDHLVEAAEKLATMARFTQHSANAN